MKKLLLLVFMIYCVFTINAQTIHWITFIDTTDERVGLLDVTGRKVLYSRFINVVNAALAEKGYNSDVWDFYDNRTSPENCKMAVEGLSCRPEDIIVFYYIGHGTHARREDNPYPQMLLGCDWSEEHKFIPLSWVHEKLKNKGARLVASIGMCCNVVQGARAKKVPDFSVNYGNTYLTQKELTAIQNMFLGYKGDFILSSASVGQSSLGGSTPLGDMDIFTAVLVSTFDEAASDGKLEWNSLFSSVKEKVDIITDGKQTPIFISNLSSASVQSVQSSGNVPESVDINLDDVNVVSNLLTRYIGFIIDSKNPVKKRIGMSDRLEELFSDGASIRIVSQDGDVVVDKESVESFLGRIATSRILLKVIPVSYSCRGNKIQELVVKEYYKRK